jgi:hypothetical protein
LLKSLFYSSNFSTKEVIYAKIGTEEKIIKYIDIQNYYPNYTKFAEEVGELINLDSTALAKSMSKFLSAENQYFMNLTSK